MRIEKDVLCTVKVKLDGKEVEVQLEDLMELYYRKTGQIKEQEE